MAKKRLGLEDLGGFVFSTNSDFEWEAEDSDTVSLTPAEQRLEAHLDKKNRGGKVAVVLKGFQGSQEALNALAKELKNHCGVGGSAKEGEIIIQGNLRDKVMDYLSKAGYRVKRVGS